MIKRELVRVYFAYIEKKKAVFFLAGITRVFPNSRITYIIEFRIDRCKHLLAKKSKLKTTNLDVQIVKL